MLARLASQSVVRSYDLNDLDMKLKTRPCEDSSHDNTGGSKV